MQDQYTNACGDDNLVLIIDPDATNWSGHYMAYNEKLTASLRARGVDVKVVCRKDIERAILSCRPHYIPALTAHSWEVANNSSNKISWRSFALECSTAIDRVSSESKSVLVYMYCGGVEHATTLLELTRKYQNVSVNINLFWLSFRICARWIEEWREFFDVLGKGVPRFVATVPTLEVQRELKQLTGCSLEVATHPSTGVSDARYIELSYRETQTRSKSFRQVLFLAAPRFEKGYEASVECVRILGGDSKLRSLIRHARTATTSAALAKPLKNMPANAMIVEGILSDDQFLQLLEEGDIVVLPYSPDAFEKRTSGLLIDAIYHRLPCVVVEGTWLAKLVRSFDCGVVIPYVKPQKLAEAVRQVAECFNEYQARAAVAGKCYFQRNSWAAFSHFLLGKTDAQ